MYRSFAYYSRLLFLYMLMRQTHTENASISCSFPKIVGKAPRTIDISSLKGKNEVARKCSMADKISLKGESTLTVDGVDNTQFFVDWVFLADELEMCVSVKNAKKLKTVQIETKSIVGKCEGPLLSFVNNANLKVLMIRNNNLGKNLSSIPSAIQVRGNRRLDADDLEELEKLRKKLNANWDLQPVGECPLPKPFISFETLDQNCTDFYGPVTLQQGITEFQYDLSKVHKFNIEGCIQIQKTELKDVAFLTAFSRFRRMRYCNQFIRGNKKLCLKNLAYLNVFFEDIQFSDNADKPCGECIGGQVTEHYLHESVNCSIIYGDLIIANLRGLPSNVENLRGIEAIVGRLIITNNTGLNNFDYLVSLKKVGRDNGDDVVIIVKDNGDLHLLELPNLLDIQLKKGGKRIELVNNPILKEDLGQATTLNTDATRRQTSVREQKESTASHENSEELGGSLTSEEASPHTQRTNRRTIFGGVAAAVSLVLLCTLAVFLLHREKSSAARLRQPPHELHTEPKKVASSSKMNTNRSEVRSTSVSSSTDAGSSTVSTSSTIEKARRSPQVLRIQRNDNRKVPEHA